MKLCSFYFRLSHIVVVSDLEKSVKNCQGCRKLSSATTQHHGQARRPSAGTQGRQHGGVDVQTLPIPVTIRVLRISCEKSLFLTDVYISTSARTTHLMKARREC